MRVLGFVVCVAAGALLVVLGMRVFLEAVTRSDPGLVLFGLLLAVLGLVCVVAAIEDI